MGYETAVYQSPSDRVFLERDYSPVLLSDLELDILCQAFQDREEEKEGSTMVGEIMI